MALINGSIPVGATFTPAGGTARTMKNLGTVNGALKLLIDDSPADIAARKLVYASVTTPTVSQNSVTGYTKQRVRLEFQVPVEIETGVWDVDKVEITTSIGTRSNSTQRALLRNLIALAGTEADFDDLFNLGAVA